MINISTLLANLKAEGLGYVPSNPGPTGTMNGVSRKFRKHRKTRNKMARRSRRINRLRS